jgi:ABC-type multidrug transport system fused ATPase/permease subunit
LVIYLVLAKGNFVNALPVIAVYAFSAYRLMPALQQIYANFTQLVYTSPALDNLYADLTKVNNQAQPNNANFSEIFLKHAIQLTDIQFTYPNAPKPSLDGISMTISAGSSVGIVGPTGGGKTTAVDVILGLLVPQIGTLAVDGVLIDDANRRRWQRAIGYVPQKIYLADNSIAANIAFGIDTDSIDNLAVERVAKIAKLHEFVINELPHGYSTIIGEGGVRLSGGQRQRIGIARALYHNPSILIMDEATSALDSLTEAAVMEAVDELARKVTVIMIAHRLSTVKHCDQIFFLDKGHIKARGSYEELIQENDVFRAMAVK